MKKILAIILVFLPLFACGSVHAEDAASEGGSVLQKVKEKVEALKKNPKAYIGTITDKTDSSIQIKDVAGKIELVSINDATHYIKIDKSETEIKFSDIAIGDFISALGTFGSGQVLNARRVILSPPPLTNRKVVIGTVASIIKKDITVNTGGEPVTISFPSKWSGPEIKELAPGDVMVAVTIATGTKLNVRTIEKISTQ
jgi:hypothetical protein